jgi:hypothetical protein
LPSFLRGAAMPRSSLLARRLASGLDRISVARLRAQVGARGAGDRRGERDLAPWLQFALDTGRVVALDVTPDQGWRFAPLRRRQVAEPAVPGGLVAGPKLPLPSIEDGTIAVLRERGVEALLRAPHCMDVALAREFRELLTPESLGGAGDALGHWASRFDEALRPTFDHRLFARAWTLSGWTAVESLGHLAHCCRKIAQVSEDGALDEAAEALAQAVELMGPAPFFLLADWAMRPEREQERRFEAAVLRWAAFIASMAIAAADCRRGALWGPLSPGGQMAARDLARRQGRATLQSVLSETDFTDRFVAEFGPRADHALARRVWDMASRRFAGALAGSVTFYVEGVQRPAPGEGPLANWRKSPGAAADLRALANLLAPAVTQIEVVDVGGAGAIAVPGADLRR